jgi:phosphoglycolate phosphatase
MRFDTFLFDLDVTLVDSVADLATAVNLLRAELSLPPLDIPTVRGYVGDGATFLVKRSLPEGLFSEERLQRFLLMRAPAGVPPHWASGRFSTSGNAPA